jgi:hypothetical protein
MSFELKRKPRNGRCLGIGDRFREEILAELAMKLQSVTYDHAMRDNEQQRAANESDK